VARDSFNRAAYRSVPQQTAYSYETEGQAPEISDEEAFELAQDRGLGEPCEICGDQAKMSTHVAIPCAHSACEACWNVWRENSSACMCCGGIVTRVKRAPVDMLAYTQYERMRAGKTEDVEWATHYMQAEKLEKMMENVSLYLTHK